MTPFICPVCGEALVEAGGSLACAAGHWFDIARQGYVNLLMRPPHTLYADVALFRARRAVFEAGFFDPLAEAVAARLSPGVVLDAGAGEGSLLYRVAGGDAELSGIGLDIARDAVRMAAGAYKGIHWCVGDLCRLPLAAASVDAVINILTPAHYGEFARVLRPGGRLIKAAPNADHLCEIRRVLGKAPPDRPLEGVLAAWPAQTFSPPETMQLRYVVQTPPPLAREVFRMTPMTAGQDIPSRLPGESTVSVTLLCGTRLGA